MPMKHLKQTLAILLFLTAANSEGQPIDTILDASPYKLHVKILKGDNPPLLFESGGGLDATQWDSIAIQVHHRLNATVITYDRAGFGKSSFDTLNYYILREIECLEAALHRLGYGDADLLLVGHSLGAFYNRLYASRHPTRVKGIILLDPRIPSQADMRFARKYYQSLDRKDFEAGYMSLYHLLGKMEQNSDYVRQAPIPPAIPVLNIMAENGPFSEASENERFKADQRDFVRASPNRSLVLAHGSSHNVPLDKPAWVIEQIISFYSRHLF